MSLADTLTNLGNLGSFIGGAVFAIGIVIWKAFTLVNQVSLLEERIVQLKHDNERIYAYLQRFDDKLEHYVEKIT